MGTCVCTTTSSGTPGCSFTWPSLRRFMDPSIGKTAARVQDSAIPQRSWMSLEVR